MKKLVSKRERKKKRRRNQIIVGFVLVFLMFLSVVGFAFQFNPNVGNGSGQEQESVEYNGFEFVYTNGFWTAGGFAFRHNPEQVEDIQPGGDELKDAFAYQNNPLYIYSESQEARSEISVNLGAIATGVDSACPEFINGEEFKCPEETAVKTCDSDNFIIIKESVNNVIIQEDNCVFIEGSPEELTEIADQFLFKILGIR